MSLLDTILEILKTDEVCKLGILFLATICLYLFQLKTKKVYKMSGTNQAPPSPAQRQPLKQAVQQRREEQKNAPASPVAPVVTAPTAAVPAPAQENAVSKLRKANSIIPDSMKKNIAASQTPAPEQPVQQNQPTHNPTAPPPPSVQQVQQPQQSHVNTPIAPTYYEGGDDNSGYLEFDLQSYRQRGVEEKFLSVSVVGMLEEVGIDDQEIANQVVNNVSRTTMRIADRAQFDALKNFFASLEWEG